jgi:MFS family permease
MLVFFRVLQGAAGGGLQPSEQSILADTFPPAKRSMAFAVYGMAVVLAPVLGPTVGGWIVDNYSWRWIFFINIPVGICRSTSPTASSKTRPTWPPSASARGRRLLGPRPAGRHHRRPADHARQGPGRRLVQLPLHRHLLRRLAAFGLVVFIWRAALTSSTPSSTCASSPSATSA